MVSDSNFKKSSNSSNVKRRYRKFFFNIAGAKGDNNVYDGVLEEDIYNVFTNIKNKIDKKYVCNGVVYMNTAIEFIIDNGWDIVGITRDAKGIFCHHFVSRNKIESLDEK